MGASSFSEISLIWILKPNSHSAIFTDYASERRRSIWPKSVPSASADVIKEQLNRTSLFHFTQLVLTVWVGDAYPGNRVENRASIKSNQLRKGGHG
jgi:hypothetical protein